MRQSKAWVIAKSSASVRVACGMYHTWDPLMDSRSRDVHAVLTMNGVTLASVNRSVSSDCFVLLSAAIQLIRFSESCNVRVETRQNRRVVGNAKGVREWNVGLLWRLSKVPSNDLTSLVGKGTVEGELLLLFFNDIFQ